MSDPIIIDVEASGLHAESYPIEIAVLIDGRCHSWLIKPERQWRYWDLNAEKIHGISRETLLQEGKPAAIVASELNSVLEDTRGLVYSDADYWDSAWVQTLYMACPESPSFHVLSLFDLLEAEQIASFQEHKKRIANSGEFREHRAYEDVVIIKNAFNAASQ